MTHQRVNAAAGWQWFTLGWGLFTRSPGLWIVLALVFAIVYFVLSWIPLIGPLAAAVLAPALFGGMIHGARELDGGRTLDIAHLFQAFRDSGRAGPMLILGLVPLGASIVMAVLAAILVGGAMGMGGTGGMHGPEGPMMGVFAVGGFVFLAASLVLGLATGALLMFAIPRVMLNLATPVDALTQSAVAVRDNLAAFLLFAGVYIVLAIVAMIPFGLGFLVLLPVVAGAVHAAHRQVFGDDPAAGTGDGQPPRGVDAPA